MSYAPENIRLSHRQRAPPSKAVKPPLLVRVSNWDRSTPSVARTCSNDKSPALRSGWKFTVTRNVGSSDGPDANLAIADRALASADSGGGVHMESLFTFVRQTTRITDLRSAMLPFSKRTDRNFGACDWYARHGHWLLGFKSHLRDRNRKEISIPNENFRRTIAR
jgi:hypothetical protein